MSANLLTFDSADVLYVLNFAMCNTQKKIIHDETIYRYLFVYEFEITNQKGEWVKENRYYNKLMEIGMPGFNLVNGKIKSINPKAIVLRSVTI